MMYLRKTRALVLVLWTCCSIAVVAKAQNAVSPAFDDPRYSLISDAFSPPVSYAIEQLADRYILKFKIGTFSKDGTGSHLTVGIGGTRVVFLTEADATATFGNGEANYVFQVSAQTLGPLHERTIRLGAAVVWDGGPDGSPRLEERFLQPGLALAGGLSKNPANWASIDLAERESLIVSRQQQIAFDIEQPMDGKATVVIENAQGQRVRNLLSGTLMKKGTNRVVWDGRDDSGTLVPVGSYNWRAISHPGIEPHYLFSFYNHGNPPWRDASPSSAWLADHSNAVAAASFGGHIYLGAPVAESGHHVVKVNEEGETEGHTDIALIFGRGKMFLLADETGFYAVMEGTPTFEPFRDEPNGGWSYRRPLALLHWDLHEQPVNYDGVRGEKEVRKNLFRGVGAHMPVQQIPLVNNLAGAALIAGKIYLSLAKENEILILDATTGNQSGTIPLVNPGLLAADENRRLIAFSDGELVRIDPESRAVTHLFSPKLSSLPGIGDPEDATYGFQGQNPTGIAIGPKDEIYLSDNGTDQNIKVFSTAGILLREIGRRGGRPLVGPWFDGAMYRPHGITVDGAGQLWVTETDEAPRRISVWNAATGRFLRQYFGPTRYGAPQASFDTANHAMWIGGGALWKLDFLQKNATIVSTLFRQTTPNQMQNRMMGLYWTFYHLNGRTFLIGYGEGQSIYELKKDGSLKLWATCGTLSSIAQMPRWTLPKTVADLPQVKEMFAANARQFHVDGNASSWGPWNDRVQFEEPLLRDIGILWVDKNGDDLPEPEEFEVLPAGDTFFTPGWGTGSPTLDLTIPVRIDGRYSLLHLTPDGFLPSGAPNYSLNRALLRATPLDFEPKTEGDGGNSIQDSFHREIFNTTPLRGVSPEGQTLWTFPNHWVGVHGSHNAPLPTSGEMQGVLYFLGTAPFDAQADVTVMNGNHGRYFVMTTDGLYLDEFFQDVRVSYSNNAYRIGGEAFGGYFGKGENGKYYLQSGHTDYRIFELSGLQQAVRSSGTVTINEKQARAAETNLRRQVAQNQLQRYASIPPVVSDRQLPVSPALWPGQWSTIQWGNAAGTYPFAEVKIVRSSTMLHLAWRVSDPSPWKNNGTDWEALFKTGDSVDFQFSTDPAAAPTRNGPTFGDKRLLIAPFHGRPIAVLYTYKTKDATQSVSFSSPWSSTRVDKVEQLKRAQITVSTQSDHYEVVASVPLADLEIPEVSVAVQLKGDLGVIYGDVTGAVDQLRSYWSNQATGLVNDVPGEATVAPSLWGTLNFEAAR